jgi:signal transduction histidine kinase
MVGCGLIALLVSLMLGDLMARRVLRPVSAIANTARTIAQTDDLSQRIPYNRPDELGSMVITFNETLDRLQRLFESQGRFLSDVSHEFSTPLTTIRGNIDLIRRYGNDPHSLEVIEEEVKHMSVLVADLLMLAKADAGQIPFTFDRLDLSRFVVKDVYTHIQKMAHNIHQVELGHVEEDVTIQADVNYLRQLFNHLVTNAVRYTPEGGVIRIWQTTSFNQAQVHISDTGVGIPPEDLPHIFERFYRVDKARSRAAGGTGLGLSIAQWIAEMHGGKIVVTSSVGQGTIFTVSLPIPENLARTQVSEEAQRRMAV